MNISDASLSLKEIEELLEGELTKENNDLSMIGDLDLTLEDYNCLLFKLRKMLKSKNCLSLLIKYKLCFTTAWIFDYKFEGKTGDERVTKILNEVPQHQIRYSLNILASVLDEFGFVDSRINMDNLDGLVSMMEINSGIGERKKII